VLLTSEVPETPRDVLFLDRSVPVLEEGIVNVKAIQTARGAGLETRVCRLRGVISDRNHPATESLTP
jgi:hypothetical protein